MKSIILGLAIFVMGAAAGIETFSGAWWAWVMAGNTLAAFAGHDREN